MRGATPTCHLGALGTLFPFGGVCWAFEISSQALAKCEADKASSSVSLWGPDTSVFLPSPKKRLWKTHPNISMSKWVVCVFQEYLLFTSEPQEKGVWGNFLCGDWSSEQKMSYWIKPNYGVSLVVQWLRICLPMQGTQVRALVWEDLTCRGATKFVRHNYWACALEPTSHNYWARVLQLLKSACLEPVLHKKRSHCDEKPAYHNEE